MVIDIDKTVRELIQELHVEYFKAGESDQSQICAEALGYLGVHGTVPLDQPQKQDFAIRKCLKVISEGRRVMSDDKTTTQCVLCDAEIDLIQSHNAQPLAEGRCCSDCNVLGVIPARLQQMTGSGEAVLKAVLKQLREGELDDLMIGTLQEIAKEKGDE